MRKLSTLIVASTLALSCSSIAFAEGTAAKPAAASTETSATSESSQEHMMHRHNPFAKLDLTEKQRAEMKALWKSSDVKANHEEMKKQMDSLHALAASDSFDEAKAKSTVDDIAKVRAEKLLERIRLENKMYNVLTPAQKKQFNENYLKHQEKMDKHHHKKHHDDDAE
jgi:protein CpxP